MRNLILLSPPSGGKGTISEYLINKYNYNHYSVGNILRVKAKENEEIEKLLSTGDLLDDDLIISLIKEVNIKEPFILDGFPRTLTQAQSLTFIKDYTVVYIDVDKEVALERVLNRKMCPSCNKIYSNKKICPDCNVPLIIRIDDNEETFLNRFDEFERVTKPLIEYYKDNLHIITNQNLDETFKNIERIIHD